MKNKILSKDSLKVKNVLLQSTNTENSYLQSHSNSNHQRNKPFYLKTDKTDKSTSYTNVNAPSGDLVNRYQSNDSKKSLKSTLIFSPNPKNILIKYKPKHLVLKGTIIPLPTLGKSTISCEKLFGNLKNKNSCNFDRIFRDNNLKNEMEFRNSYIIKYSKNSESFNKLLSYKDLITENQRKNFENLLSDFSKFLDKQLQIFLNSNNDSQNINSYKDSRYNAKICSSISNTNCGFNDHKIIIFSYEFNLIILKLFYLLFKELKSCRDIISNFKKSAFDQQLKLNTLTKKYSDELSNSKFIPYHSTKNNKKSEILNKDNQKEKEKENEHLLQIFGLESEIRNLTKLLDINQTYYKKYIDTLDKYEKNKLYTETLKTDFNKKLREKKTEFLIEKDKQDELINKFSDLEKVIQELRREKEKQRILNIETTTKISKLNMEISERNENLVMMNEELEFFIYQLSKEKSQHKNTMDALKNLENRIYIESKEKQEKERIEKEKLMKEKIEKEKSMKERLGRDKREKTRKVVGKF